VEKQQKITSKKKYTKLAEPKFKIHKKERGAHKYQRLSKTNDTPPILDK